MQTSLIFLCGNEAGSQESLQQAGTQWRGGWPALEMREALRAHCWETWSGEKKKKIKCNCEYTSLVTLLHRFSRVRLCETHSQQPTRLPLPGILQARTLEWVAISFSNAWKWKVKVKSLSRVRLLATSWTAAHQAPPSMGFSRQEYWSGVPLPSPLSGTSHVLCAWKSHGYCNWGSESIVAFHFNWLK